ncbi:MAG: selenocysteine-specific translation elongation factor [Armatimonadetes bacterium]|nr:selenocysteine-specific translation elongation factor [Armatimonadota bacterium]
MFLSFLIFDFMKHLIIGTAGHVDHGKTSLIHALTGTNTDRLREEQERGMSIELGFASFTLPSGVEAGIVDVPGHERFLKNMLAGAGGMDLVLLVIAADEGVMPQTQEHLDILQILQAKSGIIALTKADLVEPEWLEMMEEEIRERLQGTFLADAPMLPVSAVSRQGLPELTREIDARAQEIQERSATGPFRLPVDRVFTMPGFGTVVTGTLWSGRIRVGDAVQLQPSGGASRVRGLQSHGRKVEEVAAGSRAAVNLAGLDVEDVRRGDVVAPPGLLRPTYIVDVQAELLPDLDRPLANRTRIRLHIGTDEIIGRMVLLDREEAEPGSGVPAQLQLEEPVAALRGDRFVLRLFSPTYLLGGGTVLDPNARRHRRFDEKVLDRLAVLEVGGLEDQVTQALRERGVALSAPKDIAGILSADVSEVSEALAHMAESGAAVAVGDRFIGAEVLDRVERDLETMLENFHRRHSLRAGLPREEAKSRVAPKLDNRSWNALLEALNGRERIALAPATLRLASHEVAFTPEQRALADRIEFRYTAEPYNPPSADEVIEASGKGAEELFDALVEQGTLVKIANDLYLHRTAVEGAIETIRASVGGEEGFTAAQARDQLGSSRKVVIPLLEYLDAQRITRRMGDMRILEA